ncbi:hypothetical protein GCM10022224_030990 [Nonomuraea antimicrobica]|uniref:Uncharacterized protein n=1 Tax=Nonomuraea antimicrobica TaxID=561173 RepID=A0ABP7BMF7_9ACTN
MLTVVGKNRQTRHVPLHPSTARMLAGYAARRDRLCRSPACDSFFFTTTGHRPRADQAYRFADRFQCTVDLRRPPPGVLVLVVAHGGDVRLVQMAQAIVLQVDPFVFGVTTFAGQVVDPPGRP